MTFPNRDSAIDPVQKNILQVYGLALSRMIRDYRLLSTILLISIYIVLSTLLTPYMAAATFSYLCLVAGLFLRKEQRTHMILMGIGIASDLLIVLALEFNRHAIKTAMSFSLSALQQLHIAASSLATILYIPIVVLGLMRFYGNGGTKARLTHMRLGIAAFVFRSLGFILMFSLLWKKS